MWVLMVKSGNGEYGCILAAIGMSLLQEWRLNSKPEGMLEVGEQEVSADKVGNSPAVSDVEKKCNYIDKPVHNCIR